MAEDLLEDLFQHIYSAPGTRVLLIGDPAQLPPVGSDHSPALDPKELHAFGLVAGALEMTDVVRQAAASEYWPLPRDLRALLTEESPLPQFPPGISGCHSGGRP